MKKIGFIGLGDQGAPIARRMIDAGLPVVLWARRPETLAPFADGPAELELDIEMFARRVDYVGICVVDDSGVRSICERLMANLRPSSVLVIHSTVSPALCKALSLEAEMRGLKLIDAPVSGGSPAASAGKLTVMVGGEAAVLDEIRTILETFSELIIHLGAVGAGQNAKLINNALLAANIGLAHQALEAAQALSLDKAAFVRLVNASSGRSFGFEVRARMPHPAAFAHGAKLLAKDVDLLEAVLGSHASLAPIKNAAQTFLKHALSPSGAEKS